MYAFCALMISARDALTRLQDGNRRFAANMRSPDLLPARGRGGELPIEQWPFAIILGCSDSRVPAEIVFDQGLGDLFVIRVAGNIVAPSQVGQRRVCRRALRHAAGGGAGTLAVRRDPGDARRAPAPDGQPVAQPALDRGSHPAVGRSRCCGPTSGTTSGARSTGGAGERPRVRGPPAPRLGCA